MAPPSPLGIFIAVGSVVFLVGGLIAFYRPSLTVYHIPRLVLVLLTITSILWGVVGVAATILFPEIMAPEPTSGFAVVVIYSYVGFFVTFVFAVASWFESFKMSASILAALGSAGGVAVSDIILPGLFDRGFVMIGTLAGLSVLIGILTWVALRVIENSSRRSFSERMNA